MNVWVHKCFPSYRVHEGIPKYIGLVGCLSRIGRVDSIIGKMGAVGKATSEWEPGFRPRCFQGSPFQQRWKRWGRSVSRVGETRHIFSQTAARIWFFFMMSVQIECRIFSVFPKPGRLLSGNPSVERTLSLPSNPTPPGTFLLPSYPLASLPGSVLTPTLSRRRRADSSLSMSNTWPNKREISPHRRDASPWRDSAGMNTSSSKTYTTNAVFQWQMCEDGLRGSKHCRYWCDV